MQEQLPNRGPQIPETGYQEQPETLGTAGQGQQATPEQQAAYNKFVVLGMRILSDEQFSSKVLALLQKSQDDRIGAVADILAKVGGKIYRDAAQQGEEIDPSVMMSGGWEIMQRLVEMAGYAGMEPLSEDEMEGAFYQAVDQVRVALAKAGLIDKNVVEGDANTLRQMEESGAFADMAGQGAPQEQPPQQPMGLGG